MSAESSYPGIFVLYREPMSLAAIIYHAVDIELEKEACNRLVEFLREGLLDSSCPERELKFRVTTLEEHLRIFKDRITFELLKNG